MKRNGEMNYLSACSVKNLEVVIGSVDLGAFSRAVLNCWIILLHKT